MSALPLESFNFDPFPQGGCPPIWFICPLKGLYAADRDQAPFQCVLVKIFIILANTADLLFNIILP